MHACLHAMSHLGYVASQKVACGEGSCCHSISTHAVLLSTPTLLIHHHIEALSPRGEQVMLQGGGPVVGVHHMTGGAMGFCNPLRKLPGIGNGG